MKTILASETGMNKRENKPQMLYLGALRVASCCMPTLHTQSYSTHSCPWTHTTQWNAMGAHDTMERKKRTRHMQHTRRDTHDIMERTRRTQSIHTQTDHTWQHSNAVVPFCLTEQIALGKTASRMASPTHTNTHDSTVHFAASSSLPSNPRGKRLYRHAKRCQDELACSLANIPQGCRLGHAQICKSPLRNRCTNRLQWLIRLAG